MSINGLPTRNDGFPILKKMGDLGLPNPWGGHTQLVVFVVVTARVAVVVGLYHRCFIIFLHALHYLIKINHDWFSLLLNPYYSTMVLAAINMIRSWLLLCSQMTNPHQPKMLANQVFAPTIKPLDQAL